MMCFDLTHSLTPSARSGFDLTRSFPQRGQVALDLTRSLAPRESLHSARSGCGLSSVWSDCVFLEALSSLIHRKDEGTRTIRPCRREGGPGVFCLFYDGCCRRSSEAVCWWAAWSLCGFLTSASVSGKSYVSLGASRVLAGGPRVGG